MDYLFFYIIGNLSVALFVVCMGMMGETRFGIVLSLLTVLSAMFIAIPLILVAIINRIALKNNYIQYHILRFKISLGMMDNKPRSFYERFFSLAKNTDNLYIRKAAARLRDRLDSRDG